MAKPNLLASQRNDVLKAIQDLRFNPFEFEWQESRSRFKRLSTIAMLVHRPTGYYFKFDYDSDGFYVAIYSPGDDSIDKMNTCYDWKSTLDRLGSWLENIYYETSTPDLWDALSAETKLVELGAEPELDNSPFSASEKEQITRCLDEIKQHLVLSQKLTEEQQKIVESRFRYLEEASERLGRKDWLNILIGVLLGAVIQLGLPADSAREVFRFAWQVVRHLLGSTSSLPSIP